jgi:hypothetical protein
MSLGDPCVGYERGARCRRSRWLTRQMTTCSVALVVVAIAGGCGAGSHPKAVSATDAPTIVEHTAVVPPTTPGWKWPKVPTSSSPYSKAGGADVPAPDDPLTAKLYRRLRGLDLIGSAGSRWDASRLAHLVVEQWSSASDAHSAMSAYREYAHGWADNAGTVSDKDVSGLGDEAWRISATGSSPEVTYKWRRGNLIFEAHMQCYPQSCPSDVIDAARNWVDAIDEEARRPSA